MRTTCIVTLVTAAMLLAAGRVAAQPALDRVEQQMRQPATANAGATAPAGVTAAEPGYLGVIADDRQDQGRGVRVIEVFTDGPGAQGGLKTGDVITAINGHAIAQMDDLANIIERSSAGAKLEFSVERDGAAHKQSVTLGRRPPPTERPVPQFGRIPNELPPGRVAGSAAAGTATAGGPRLGVRTVPVTDEVRRQYNLPDTAGALVTGITFGTPAEKAAIPLAAVITAVDGQPINSPAELAELIRRADAGREVELAYTKDGETHKKRITLAGSPMPAANPAPAAMAGSGPANTATLPAPSDAAAPAAMPGPGAQAQVARRPVDMPQAAESGGRVVQQAARIQALEQRIRELEERLQKLEAANNSDSK